MIVSWLSTVRVIRIFSSAAAAIRISSPTAMAKIFNPIGKRMAPPPSGTQPVAGMGRPARYVADYSGTALLSAGYFIRHFPDTEVAAREADLLPVGYFHVVFTLPAEISPIAYQNKAVVYGLLLRTAAETLLTIAADPRHLGARIGATAVLHSWGSAMTHHPHVHMIVPGGGISLDGTRWVRC